MSEQYQKAQLRILDSIDKDFDDARVSLSLIERLTEQSANSNTSNFSNEELQTLIRNCIHSVILNLTKTLERPSKNKKNETYNIELLIDNRCHDEDKDRLRDKCKKIRGNQVYNQLEKYRNNIIAHRNIVYGSYQAMGDIFSECKDYLLANKERIQTLIGEINTLQMEIKDSRNKKLGRPDFGGDLFEINVVVSK